MHDKWTNQVELASDLEWLLLSDQTKSDELMVHLVGDFGVGLSLLMQTTFPDLADRKVALLESLVQIVLHRSSYHSDTSVKVWIYSQAMEVVWKIRRSLSLRRLWNRIAEKRTAESTFKNTGLPGWLWILPEEDRLAIVMHRFLGLEDHEIAQVLQVSEERITRNMIIVDQAFPPQGQSHLSQVLEITHQELLVESATAHLANRLPRGRLRRTILEMSWAVGAVMLVALLTRFYDLRNPDPVRQAVEFSFLSPSTKSTETPPSPPALAPLDAHFTSDEIALRYYQRKIGEESIWEDVMVLLAGVQGGSKVYSLTRIEIAWDNLGKQLLILVGPPEGPPDSGLYADETTFSEITIRDGRMAGISELDLQEPQTWFYMISLAMDIQMNNLDGNWFFVPRALDKIAGRDALSVEVINANGIIENIAWLDTQTGILLRQRRNAEQGQPSGLVLETIVTKLSMNEPFPHDYFSTEISRSINFSTPENLWWSGANIGPTLRFLEEGNIATSQGENPMPSLHYEISEIQDQEKRRFSTKVFADSTLIGTYPMGDPWNVLCERSPDGSRVAFIEDRRFEFGSTIPSKVLHWFSLDNPGALQTPLPGVDPTRFTFSPDSQSLAVHASNEVSLIDLETGQLTFLLEVPAVDRLVFSDDGQYLGVLRGPTQSAGKTSIWIIYLPNRLVVESLTLGPDQDWDSQRAEIFATRQIDFTKPIYFGLENCR